MSMRRWMLTGLFVGSVGICGCAGEPSDEERATEVAAAAQGVIGQELEAWRAAAKEMMDAAPTPSGRGWDAEKDAAAIEAMRAAWTKTRTTYEHVEGAVAPLFPDIDASTDARYEAFLVTLGNQADPDLFDDQGVTGMHAIERILFSDVTPASVVTFEKGLPGYSPAAFPATEAEAVAFKTKLCERLVADIESMQAQWGAASVDLPGAFDGLISLMNEQQEKVNKAATGEEESRYSQKTLADLRANLVGTRQIYALFQPWIVAKEGGASADENIQKGFEALDKAYSATAGDSIPAPPATWSSVNPSAADLKTPFGELFTTVTTAVDPQRDGSIVDEMNNAAGLIGFPRFQEGE